jgi:hypothetical protein
MVVTTPDDSNTTAPPTEPPDPESIPFEGDTEPDPVPESTTEEEQPDPVDTEPTEPSPTFSTPQEPLNDTLISIRDILHGHSTWGHFINTKPTLSDAREALQICWRYHPDNDGSVEAAPSRSLGDIEAMREDLMHLSAIGVRLAGISAFYESGAKSADNERKLARSRAWARITQEVREGKHGPGRVTIDDKKNLAEACIADYYQAQSELELYGRILNWVRASTRDMVETLQVLVQSSMREERGDAKLY